MNSFQIQFDQIIDYLKYDDFVVLTKRIIDLTLDTESVLFYQKTNDLLDWLDSNLENTAEKKSRFKQLLEELYLELNAKTIVEPKVLVSADGLQKVDFH